MKRKITVLLFTIFITSMVAFFATACNVEPPHEHSFTLHQATETYIYSHATCEEKAKYYVSCSCGEKGEETFEYGSALGHIYGAFISLGNARHEKVCLNDDSHVITEDCSGGTATCTEKAKCSKCNVEYGEELGHNYGGWITAGNGKHKKVCLNDDSHIITEDCSGGTATCDNGAVCSTCGGEYGESLGHNYKTVVNLGNGKHKKVCLNDSGHEIIEDCSGGTATCDNKPVCSTCNVEYGKVLGHRYFLYEKGEIGEHFVICLNDSSHVITESCSGGTATCEVGAVCSKCKQVYTSEKGHDYSIYSVFGKSRHKVTCANDSSHIKYEDCYGGVATCDAYGTCKGCNQEYIAPLGHKYLQIESLGNGTHKLICINDSSHNYIVNCSGGTATCENKPKCSTCGGEYGESLGHNYSSNYTYNFDATCYSYGTESARCLAVGCQSVDTRPVVNGFYAHKTKTIYSKYPNCTEGGWSSYLKCEICDYETDHEVYEALGHDYNYIEAILPTCVDYGTTQTVYCSRCNFFEGGEGIEPLGHDLKTFERVEPTCIDTGSEYYEYCNRCDYAMEKVIIPKKGHVLTQHDYKKPTCTEVGNSAYVTCSVCNFSTYEELPMHNYVRARCVDCEKIRPVDEYLLFELNSKGTYRVGAKRENIDWAIIPEEYNGIRVTGILPYGFYMCYDIEGIEMPYVETVSVRSFNGCINLKTVCAPNVKIVDEMAFMDCNSLVEIDLPAIEAVYSASFYSCDNLRKITFGENLVKVNKAGRGMFEYCISITELYVPSYDKINFEHCVKFDWVSDYNVFKGKESDFEQVIINDFVLKNNNGTWVIVDYVGSGVGVLPESVNGSSYEMGILSRFYNLTELVIPANITKFGEDFLRFTTNLKKITFNGTIEEIKDFPFTGILLEEVYCNEYVLKLENGEYNLYLNSYDDLASYINNEYAYIIRDSFAGNAEDTKTNVYINGELITDLVIPEGITEIPENFFEGFNFKTLTLPSSLKVINNYAFWYCDKLTNVFGGENVEIIGNYAFAYCSSLEEITINAKTTNIGVAAFSGCVNLRKVINYSSLNINLSRRDYYGNVAYYAVVVESGEGEDIVTDDGFTFRNIGGEYNLIDYPRNARILTLPDNVNGNSYVIPSYAISENKVINKVVIPNGVTRIRAYAFKNCPNLISVTMGESVRMESLAFNGCHLISEVYDLRTEKDRVIIGARDQFASLDEQTNLYVDGEYIFQYTGGVHYFLGSVYKVDKFDFSNIDFEYVIPAEAFSKNNDFVKEIIFGGSVVIGDGAFRDTKNLKKVTFNVKKATLKSTAFYSSRIESVTFNKDAQLTLGTSVFYGCEKLSKVELSNHVESIPKWAFEECVSLKEIKLASTVKEIGDRAFSNVSITEIDLPYSLEKIGDYAFRLLEFEHVVFSENVKYIGNHAFSEVTSVSVFSNRLEFVGNVAFGVALQSITVGEHVNLRYENSCVVFGDTLISPTSRYVVIPSGVKTLGAQSFYATQMVEYELPKGIEVIGDSAFSYSAFTKIKLPHGLVKIGDVAFYGSELLETIIIPSTVKEIGANALPSHSWLTIYYEGTEEQFAEVTKSSALNPYFYSEEEPTKTEDGTAYVGRYWRYVNDVPTVWAVV